MTSRSTASPSRLPSRAAPWILMCSTITGFAPATIGGTTVCTWAAILEPGVMAIINTTTQNKFVDFIAVLTWKLVAIAGRLPAICLSAACFFSDPPFDIRPQVFIHAGPRHGKLLTRIRIRF